MQSKSLQTDAGSRISGEGTLPERKLGLKQRLFDEVIKFLAIAFYLWVMYGVFALHESVVSAKDHIEGLGRCFRLDALGHPGHNLGL